MCPDPQILSIYMDGELPSPWKEKLEIHLAECSACGEKLKKFNQLRGLLKGDEEYLHAENRYIDAAKDKIWQKLESEHNYHQRRQIRRFNVWQRKLSVPLPVAAAAAVVIVIMAAAGLYGGFSRQVIQPVEFAAADYPIIEYSNREYPNRANIILAAEEEMPGIMPIADLNSVLQLLDSNGNDILIMRLPESKSFFRSGEPAIIRAADYSRSYP